MASGSAIAVISKVSSKITSKQDTGLTRCRDWESILALQKRIPCSLLLVHGHIVIFFNDDHGLSNNGFDPLVAMRIVGALGNRAGRLRNGQRSVQTPNRTGESNGRTGLAWKRNFLRNIGGESVLHGVSKGQAEEREREREYGFGIRQDAIYDVVFGVKQSLVCLFLMLLFCFPALFHSVSTGSSSWKENA